MSWGMPKLVGILGVKIQGRALAYIQVKIEYLHGLSFFYVKKSMFISSSSSELTVVKAFSTK